VAISGVNFGAVQGSSHVTFAGTAASVVSWSDTAILTTVPGSLILGETAPVVISTSVGASNAMDFLPVSTSAPYHVSPQTINLLAGQTRTISVTDSNGNAVTGMEWTTSNPSVVSLSNDDPPILTAVAPGTAIVYVVGMPVLVTVYSGTSLPPGTPIWSVPTTSVSSAPLAIPAVPSASGADLLVLDDVGLTALASDGSSVWQMPLVRDSATQVIPDFSGGALVTQPYSYTDALGSHSTHVLQKLDPSTHQLTTLYTFSDVVTGPPYQAFSDSGSSQVIVPHPSGVVFVLDFPATYWIGYAGCPHVIACSASVSVIDPSTGQTLGAVQLDDSLWLPAPYDYYFPPLVGQMIVAGDGNAYLPYVYYDQDGTYLVVLRISPDGSSQKIQLGQWTYGTENSNQPGIGISGWTVGAFYNVPWLTTITNGDSGAAILSQLGTSQALNQISYVSQTGLTSQVTLGVDPAVNTWLNPVMLSLQREDGSYIGADMAGNLFAIATDGTILWQKQLGAVVTPLYATADGGAIVTSTPPCSQEVSAPPYGRPPCPLGTPPSSLGTLYTVDKNSNVTSQTPDTGARISWTGNWYDPPASGGTLSAETGVITVDYANGNAVQDGGNPSQTGVSVHGVQKLYRNQIASIAQGYAAEGSTLWVPYDVTTYTGSRSPSVKSYNKDTCNIFVGDVLNMAQRAVLHQLKGDTSYVPSPFVLSSPLPFVPMSSPDNMSAPQFYHVSLLHPSQTGWAYIGSKDWTTWSFYSNQPKPSPGQGPVSGQVKSGAACWAPVPGGPASAEPGDVMAEYAYAGIVHHTAINVVPGPSGQVASTSGVNVTFTDTVVQSNWGYRTTVAPPYYNHGLEQDVIARRWSCY
jgi:hypothetical protein